MPFVPDVTETAIRDLLIDALGVAPATVAAMTKVSEPLSLLQRPR